MTDTNQKQLGNTLWSIADQLRGAMDADDFRAVSQLSARYSAGRGRTACNPPFSLRWEPNDALADNVRFKTHGLAPKSAADFAFLLHGFHFLKDEGVMAIILPHGVLFRGGAEARIREKLINDGHIDAVIGLPANLFYSTGIPVCILVLKKCKKPDDTTAAKKHREEIAVLDSYSLI